MKGAYRNISGQVLFLIVILAVVIFIMAMLKTGFFNFKASFVPEFEGNEALIKNRYYNKPYHFSISLPDAKWKLDYSSRIKQTHTIHFNSPILNKLKLIIRMSHQVADDTLGIIDVGIILFQKPKSAVELARQSLNDIIKFFPEPDSIVITQNVTPSGRGKNLSAFYMLELPEEPSVRFPVIIPLFKVRGQTIYVINCYAKYETYDILKSDFESVLTSLQIY